jgi:hypothetical protein
MITLVEAKALLQEVGCTVVPTHTDKYIQVWNASGLDERIECTVEAINDYIHSED